MNKKVFFYILDNFEKILCAIFTTTLVFCIGLQVFMRYVFQVGVTWSEELSRFAFIWSVYLGTSLAAQKEQHVRVTAQFYLLPERLRPYLWILADAVWIVFNILFTIEGIKLVRHAFKYPEITPSLGWSAAYIYTIIPLGFALMSFRILQVYYRGFRNQTWRDIAKVGGV
jgi:TRAP-type C4-dicarboxylate transport system permease small subunit